MATRGISSTRNHKDTQGFTAGLSSAILEWLLIILLFVDAFFAYLVTKFARFCELQTPCLFCSRLDHVFGNVKPQFYWDLVCGSHKLEISSLVFCQNHDILADVHGLCEGCLSSFFNDKKSNSKTYKMLVAKLGKDHECCIHKNSLKHLMFGSSREKLCSCCNEPWKLRSYYAHRFLPTKSMGPDVSEFNMSLSGPARRICPTLFDGLGKRRKETQSSHLGYLGFDPLSHIGYSELNLTSDSESEVIFSDDDDVSAQARETDDLKEQFLSHHLQRESHTSASNILHKALSEVLSMDKINNQTTESIPLVSVREDVPQCGRSSSMASVGHGLEELNWQQVEQKSHPGLPELISLHDIPSSSNTAEALVNVSGETLDVMGIGDLVQASAEVRQLECGVGIRTNLGLKADEVVAFSGENLDIQGIGDIGHSTITKSGNICTSEGGLASTAEAPILKNAQVLNDLRPPLLNLMETTDSYGQAIANKGGQTSGMLTELLAMKDSPKFNEDLKLLLSQISPARGIELPRLSTARGLELSTIDTSPKVRELGEELKTSDVPSSIASFSVRPSMERNESGIDSLDGSIVGEVEGENMVDRLKRQVEYDRNSLSALYKELEEERNASAIAANQALAMITRLQEEKAALHMEALQYLRMMEEQAEYDVEALQKANDLLADKEKEIQDLEAELDLYRNKLQEETIADNIESDDLNVAEVSMVRSDLCSNDTNGPSTPRSMEKCDNINKTENNDVVYGDNGGIIDSSLLDFEEERLFISECLQKMKNMFNLRSENGVHVDQANGGDSGRQEHRMTDVSHHHSEELIQENSHMDKNTPLMQNDSSVSEEGLSGQERSTTSVGDSQIICEEYRHFDGPNTNISSRGAGLVSLENEFLDLNDRLETLEADRNFLKHIVNSLQNGNEGLEFIQEIALHLRELRSIRIRRGEKEA